MSWAEAKSAAQVKKMGKESIEGIIKEFGDMTPSERDLYYNRVLFREEANVRPAEEYRGDVPPEQIPVSEVKQQEARDLIEQYRRNASEEPPLPEE
jgi:hypothetical protein